MIEQYIWGINGRHGDSMGIPYKNMSAHISSFSDILVGLRWDTLSTLHFTEKELSQHGVE